MSGEGVGRWIGVVGEATKEMETTTMMEERGERKRERFGKGSQN